MTSLLREWTTCANCGRKVSETSGSFELNEKTDRFELLCEECTPITTLI
jgi:DNA-directed RNA polymerase subunit RPC12/RpoP